jgi:hypothetical protein
MPVNPTPFLHDVRRSRRKWRHLRRECGVEDWVCRWEGQAGTEAAVLDGREWEVVQLLRVARLGGTGCDDDGWGTRVRAGKHGASSRAAIGLISWQATYK